MSQFFIRDFKNGEKKEGESTSLRRDIALNASKIAGLTVSKPKLQNDPQLNDPVLSNRSVSEIRSTFEIKNKIENSSS